MALVLLKRPSYTTLLMMVVIPPVFRAIDMLNLSNFRMIVVCGSLVGTWAGLLLTAVQKIQVIPTILQAEVYEESAAVHTHTAEK